MRTSGLRTERSGALAPISVRTRITVAVALLVALALTGAGLVVHVLATAAMRQGVLESVDQELVEFRRLQGGVDPETGLPFDSMPRLVRVFLERNVPTPSELYVGFWDGSWRQSSESSRAALRQDRAFVDAVTDRLTTGGPEWIRTEWGEVYLEVQPVRDEQRQGAFVVAHFLEDEREALAATMRTYAVAAVLALACVTALSAWVAGRLLEPVRTLRETAEAIGGSDLARRIPERGNDDITALTRTINAMLDRLALAFAGQREFLDDAGHELRTPLTVLRGHLELLASDDPDDVRRTRELLLDEVDRMSRLVDDLILLSKADRPDFVSLAPVDVDELVTTVGDKVRALGDRGWQVEARAGVTVPLDRQRVTQALLQLAHNAVRHSRRGERVTLGAQRDGDTLRLWVADEGTGVPDDLKEVIFERFRRGPHGGRPEGEDDGFGLGLSIVAAIAAGHGGGVRVEDARPRGSRFVLELPLAGRS